MLLNLRCFLNGPLVVGRIHCKDKNLVSCLPLTYTCLLSLICNFSGDVNDVTSGIVLISISSIGLCSVESYRCPFYFSRSGSIVTV